METLELEAAEFICTADDPQWLTLRAKGIGGSEAATILGMNAYTDPHTLWLQKIGAEAPADAGEAAWWGRENEAVILKRYAMETGRKLSHRGRMYRSRALPFLQATLDAIVVFEDGELGVLQAKLTTRTGDWQQGIPDYVFAQVQHEMIVLGLRRGAVAVNMNGTKLYHDVVAYDDEYCAEYVKRAAAFWEAVQTQEPPALTPTEACGRAIARYYGEEEAGKTVHLPADMISLDIRREEIGTDTRGEMATLVREKLGIDNELKNAIGDAQYGLLPNGVRYKWGTVKRAAKCCPKCSHVLSDAMSYRSLTRSDRAK